MAEQRTIDNPNDLAIREQQKQQRLAMGQKAQRRDTVEPQFATQVFSFRFRKHIGTQFSGLWELCAMDKKGKVEEVIVDADSLPEVLERIGNIFANLGY